MSKSKRQFAKRKAREKNSRKKVLKKRIALREERNAEEQMLNAISASQERVAQIINER